MVTGTRDCRIAFAIGNGVARQPSSLPATSAGMASPLPAKRIHSTS